MIDLYTIALATMTGFFMVLLRHKGGVLGPVWETAILSVIIVAFGGTTWWCYYLWVSLGSSVIGAWSHRSVSQFWIPYLISMTISVFSIVARNVPWVPTFETSSPLPWVYLATCVWFRELQGLTNPRMRLIVSLVPPVWLGVWCLSQLSHHRDSAGCFDLKVFFLGTVIGMPMIVARNMYGVTIPFFISIAIACTVVWIFTGFVYVFSTKEEEGKSSECIELLQSAKLMFSYVAMYVSYNVATAQMVAVTPSGRVPLAPSSEVPLEEV